MNCIVLGIDPAPSKESVEYDGEKWTKWWPEDLHQRVSSVKAPAIIAWDAPLSFDRSNFYARPNLTPIEQAAWKKALQGKVDEKYVDRLWIASTSDTPLFTEKEWQDWKAVRCLK